MLGEATTSDAHSMYILPYQDKAIICITCDPPKEHKFSMAKGFAQEVDGPVQVQLTGGKEQFKRSRQTRAVKPYKSIR